MTRTLNQSKRQTLNTNDPADTSPDGLILIGKLAEIASVAPSAIRFYEREGLLEPKKLGRMRTYSVADTNKLHLIVRLRRTGLPINKVREALLHSKAPHLTAQNEVLTKIIEKQVEDLLRLSEIVGEQMNNAVVLLRELDTSNTGAMT